MDIVERLREVAAERAGDGPSGKAYDPELLDVMFCAADELDQLRADLSEQCRLLGMSGEREAKHLAQIDRLRSALERCEHETTSLRVWNGTEWSYSPYQAGRIAKIARDALNASGAGGV